MRILFFSSDIRRFSFATLSCGCDSPSHPSKYPSNLLLSRITAVSYRFITYHLVRDSDSEIDRDLLEPSALSREIVPPSTADRSRILPARVELNASINSIDLSYLGALRRGALLQRPDFSFLRRIAQLCQSAGLACMQVNGHGITRVVPRHPHRGSRSPRGNAGRAGRAGGKWDFAGLCFGRVSDSRTRARRDLCAARSGAAEPLGRCIRVGGP